ncbi:NAD(P)-dependent oxidoreductase [Streptosporangium sp. KLBMP 9127]|nr:NAD(P)-dependent oxidoreductase [Streptosporangium sp. KLBMP 9127]
MDLPRITLIGLGGMGAGMGLRLLDEGFPLHVYNRTPEKGRPLIEAGARTAESLTATVAEADVVLLSLSDEEAVEEMVFGRLAPALRPGMLLIDTTTVSPEYARRSAARLRAADVGRVEACVVGNPLMARAGRLRLFTAGDPGDVERVAGLLRALGRQVTHLGGDGRACALKLAFNLLLGAQTAALAEAVAYGVRAGIDQEVLLDTMAGEGGALASPLLTFRADFMRSGVYEPPAFRASLMAKDLHLVRRDAARLGLTLPLTDSAAARFDAAVTAGDGDKDAAVILRVRERR